MGNAKRFCIFCRIHRHSVRRVAQTRKQTVTDVDSSDKKNVCEYECSDCRLLRRNTVAGSKVIGLFLHFNIVVFVLCM